MAQAHRRPWLPYQRDIADLIGERTDRGYAHPVVVVLLPRQCGKTTLIFDMAMGRCLTEADYRVALTSQTGHATTERFGERITELASTAISRSARVRRSQGTERITFRQGSYVKAFPPKDGALRGSSLDLVGVDEAQEVDETLGHQLDQTIFPTLQNRPRRQLVLIGTAGTTASDYLRRYLELGRASAGVALVEYGFPLDADPLDPAVWHAHHPGLAAGLTDEAALASALAVMGPAGFAREYGNVWQVTTDRVIPATAWLAAAAPLAKPGPGQLAFGADVTVDRTTAAIVSSWADDRGRRVVELLDQLPPQLAARRLRELHQRHGGDAWLDGTGPAATIAAELTTAKGELPGWLHVLGGRDVAAACALMLDGLLDATIVHRAEPAMDSAAAGATKRPVGDAWVWGRRTSATDVSPLTAATVAAWGQARRPPPALRPVAAAG